MADKPKLTRAERKQIEAVIRKYRGDGKPHTAQDTIPYSRLYFSHSLRSVSLSRISFIISG